MNIYRMNDLSDVYKGLLTDDLDNILNTDFNFSVDIYDSLYNRLFYFDYIKERRKVADMIRVSTTNFFVVKELIKKILEYKLQEIVEFVPIIVEENENENFYFLNLKSIVISINKEHLNEYSFKAGIQFPLCFYIKYEGITELGFFCNQEMKDYIEQNNIKGVSFEEVKYSLV